MSKNEHNEHHDGIVELDNSLPTWWVNLFYITIVFSIGYFVYYQMAGGPSLLQEYERYRNQTELQALARESSQKTATEEELRNLLKQPESIKAGSAMFQARCVSCHGTHGEGGIGPNLTDDYWLHGGKMTEIVHTIAKGVPDKGMPPWGGALSQKDIHSLAAFIKSIRGTNPTGAKAPEGALIKE